MIALTKVTIYCDGACLGNPGPGGFASLLLYASKERVVAGAEENSTNNRMELRSAIEGLKALTRKCEVDIYSDSQYLIRGITEWMKNWQLNNFKGSNNKPIANKDLWQELLLEANKHKIRWHWVRGHAGNILNERVDEIAREQALAYAHSLRLDK